MHVIYITTGGTCEHQLASLVAMIKDPCKQMNAPPHHSTYHSDFAYHNRAKPSNSPSTPVTPPKPPDDDTCKVMPTGKYILPDWVVSPRFCGASGTLNPQSRLRAWIAPRYHSPRSFYSHSGITAGVK
jgi:hypothetical protein